MLVQWECFLKNLGEWQGSFTNISSQGKILEDIPSHLSLVGFNDNKNVTLTLKRYPIGQTPKELVINFAYLNRSILFFENGAFSQGSMQWSPLGDFGGEFGLISNNRRLRLLQFFKESSLNTITLIREKSPESEQPERPQLTVDQLLGEWQGEVITIYPDLRSPSYYSSHLKIERQGEGNVVQSLSFATGDTTPTTITSSAKVENNCLFFEQSSLPVQILLLPDGASCNCPLQIKAGHPFVLELGWLLEPDTRQRIIRSYSAKGEWISSTLVTEKKVG